MTTFQDVTDMPPPRPIYRCGTCRCIVHGDEDRDQHQAWHAQVDRAVLFSSNIARPPFNFSPGAFGPKEG